MDSDECAFELMSVFSLSNSLVTHIIILDKRSVSNLQSLNHQSAESEYTTQWRSYYGANGASAPPGPPRVT